MTRDEAAKRLDGNEYAKEGSHELWAEMKAAGLVAVYGASDDLCELSGAISDEIGCYGKGEFRLTPKGLLQNECEEDGCPYCARESEAATPVEIIWHDEGDGPSWTYQTEIPHSTFTIVEDGSPYCVGIVFALADVPALRAPLPPAVSDCLEFFASVIKSGESWSPTCEEMLAKAKAP